MTASSTPRTSQWARILVRRTECTLDTFENILPDDQVKHLKERPLIRRRLHTDGLEWFYIDGRRASAADCFTPQQAAAFRLGLVSQLLPYSGNQWADCGLICLTYLRSALSHATYIGLASLFNSAIKRHALSVPIALSITASLARCKLHDEALDPYLGTGITFGNAVVSTCPNSNELDLTAISTRFEHLLSRFQVPGCSHSKMLWLLEHRLNAAGPGHDFKEEIIATLADEESYQSQLQRQAYSLPVVAIANLPEYKEILDLLDGKQLTVADIAEHLDVSARGLRDAKRTTNVAGKASIRRGRLDDLLRAGLVTVDKSVGGFYRPDKPPAYKRRRRQPRRVR